MAQIIEVNGEPVEFPDGMSDDQIASVIKQNSAPHGADTLNTDQLNSMLPVGRPTKLGNMPNGAALPYGITQEQLDAYGKTNDINNQKNQAMRDDPSMLNKLAEADKQGWLEGMGRGALNTLNEFGQGAEDLADKYLPETLSDVLNYRPFGENGMTADQRMTRRKGEMEQSNQDQLVRTIANPVATTVGAMAPYFATGAGLERGINAVAGVVSPITRELVQSGLKQAGRMEGTTPSVLSKIGEVAQTKALRMDSAPNIPSDFKRRLAFGAKAPLIGAGEGAVNYNQTAGEGAMYSAAGAGMGAIGPLRVLDKVENVRDAAGRAMIKEMDREGFALTPGVRTGNQQMQTEEAGIKNSDVLGDHFQQTVTRPNQQKMTELAGDAIGLNGRNRDAFSSEELSKHLDDLKTGYQTLEANTTGKFNQDHFKVANDVLTDLKPVHNPSGTSRNTSPDDALRYAKVQSITNQIKSESVRGPGVTGAMNRSFDGTQYQAWRQRIQDEASQAFQSGDSRLGNALNKLKANLDSALETGMGRGKASEWRDLNERYAMTNLLMKKGMTPGGAIDPLGITSAVMRDDEAIRTLTGKGGRIKNFQKIAKYNDYLNNVEGGSLTGLGSADYTANRSLGKLPLSYRLPLYARAAGGYRLSTLPTYGFGPLASLKTGRAFAQTEPADKAYEGAKMGIEGLRKAMGGQ